MSDCLTEPLPPQVREGLVPLIAAIQKEGALDNAWVKGTYDTNTQADLCK